MKRFYHAIFIIYVLIVFALIWQTVGNISAYAAPIPGRRPSPGFNPSGYDITSSNCVNTAVGNPSGANNCPSPTGGGGSPGSATGNALSDYAIKLVGALKSSCGAQVTSGNQGCVANISVDPSTKSEVVSILQNSAKGDGVLQCVGFAVGVTAGVGSKFSDTGHNAQDYNGSIRENGYTWNNNSGGASMQAGDIPVWSRPGSGANGHIAVAVPDPKSGKFPAGRGRFFIAEANGGNGTVDIAQYPTYDDFTDTGGYDFHLEGWWRKN